MRADKPAFAGMPPSGSLRLLPLPALRRRNRNNIARPGWASPRTLLPAGTQLMAPALPGRRGHFCPCKLGLPDRYFWTSERPQRPRAALRVQHLWPQGRRRQAASPIWQAIGRPLMFRDRNHVHGSKLDGGPQARPWPRDGRAVRRSFATGARPSFHGFPTTH